MKDSEKKLDQISSQLDILIDLMRKNFAFQLSKEEIPTGEIGKKLHLAKASVVEMLSGIKKRGKQSQQ